MEGPILPEGSGGEEPPEEPRRAELVYNARMAGFEALWAGQAAPGRTERKRRFSDYTEKNCEEAWGAR